MNNDIAEHFDLEPIEPKEIVVPNKINNVSDTNEQYEEAHKNIKTIADIGESMLMELSVLFSHTEDPKIMEAFTKLMKEVVSANEKLVELKGKKLEVEKAEGIAPIAEKPDVVNNNLFVGSTAEMLQKIKDLE